MNYKKTPETWSKNVILADGDYIDRVAFDLIVNFERMLERRIPQADLARWIDCVALDGGMRPKEEQETTQVILLHSKPKLENFAPADYKDLDGKAFKDSLGEFCISCVPVEEMTTMEDLFSESLQHISQQQEVKCLIVVGDERYYDRIRHILQKPEIKDKSLEATVFTMQPMAGGRFNQEILGFSLMSAMGIKSAELTEVRGEW